MSVEYPAQLRHYASDEIVVSFRDVPGCHTSGQHIEDALCEAVDALDEAITGRINRGEPIPKPSAAAPGEYMIELPSDTAVRVAANSKQVPSVAGSA